MTEKKQFKKENKVDDLLEIIAQNQLEMLQTIEKIQKDIETIHTNVFKLNSKPSVCK